MIKSFSNFINEGFSFDNYNLEDIKRNPNQPFVSEDMCKSVCKKLIKELDDTMVPEDNDLVLANVAVFLGVNFNMYFDIILKYFLEPLVDENIFNINGNRKKDDDDALTVYRNFWLTVHAAWPDKDDFSQLSSKDIEYCKKIMKKYFPWRLSDSGEINFLNDVSISDNI